MIHHQKKNKPAPWTFVFKKPEKSKPKRPIRRISRKRMRSQIIYRRRKQGFMAKHPRCQCCKRALSEDLHHKRGRIGRLLTDERFWMAVCRPCHDRIHRHPAEAVERGYLAGPGEWNTLPKPLLPLYCGD
jgi:hypothetical protein